jgi:hypothetical protein
VSSISDSELEFFFPTVERDGDRFRSECGYCGKEFTGETPEQVRLEEGVHRANQHVEGLVDKDREQSSDLGALAESWDTGQEA